ERLHADRPVAYFDGPGGTQVPQVVVDLMADYLFNHNANTHWLYPTSAETDQAIDDARRALCEFLGAAMPEEIVFGANMTTLAFHLGRALGRGWQAGDEVVVTELDHHANVAPWRALAKERGIVLRSVPFRLEDGTLDLDALAAAMGPRTRLVAVGAASNAIGTVNDVARICAMVREAGALSFVDAVHYAPHNLVDVQAIGCDFLACSAYKFYGPHIGILYGKLEHLERLDAPKLDPAPDTAPERWELGTQNHEGMVGAATAVNFLASLAGSEGTRRERLARTFAQLHSRGEALLARLWHGLERIDGVRLYGCQPGAARTPTLAFTMQGRSTGSIASALADQAVFVSNGDFYAATVAERYERGDDGFVRVGCAAYTTEAEVDRLLDAVDGL
ncbi:MAG TPA: cysteine desulfurase-like protein, partial [Gemmatimonadaceae bacterium]|nr:cysteine desulfurase-like protein [Gemmatimonadaceae bacterium]